MTACDSKRISMYIFLHAVGRIAQNIQHMAVGLLYMMTMNLLFLSKLALPVIHPTS